ncbi:CC049 protein, partial [Polyodon spathula]|nr:CC049 protein [Polyodon spathula]
MANVDLAVYNLLETFYKHSGKEGVTLTLNQKTLTNLLQQELPSIVQDATLASTDTNRDGEVDFEEFITFRNENTTTKWDRYIRDLLTGKRWPNLFQPKNKLSNESDSECSSIRESKQDGFGRKVKKTLGKLLFLTTIQVDYVEEAETEKLIGNKLVLRSRQTSRRVSVTSLPMGLQKAPYLRKRQHFGIFKRKKRKPVDKIRKQSVLTLGKLQTQAIVVFVFQVDDLIETVADRSAKLLAQRHAELEQCEFLGDEILQSSKQFQRISQKSAWKYKWKNLCFPCAWCC